MRTQFLVAYGFQMVADDTLTTDEWKKLRVYAKQKADYLLQQTIDYFRSRVEGEER